MAGVVWALSVGAWAAEGDSVPVGPVPVVPLAHPSFLDDRLVIHPVALVEVGYDSNLLATSGQRVGDSYNRDLAGIDSDLQLDPAQRLTINTDVVTTRYLHQHAFDLNGGDASAIYALTGSDLDITAHAGASRIQSVYLQTGELIIVDAYSGGGSITHRGRQDHQTLSVGYVRSVYQTDSRLFLANQADNDTYQASLEYGLDGAEHRSWYVKVGANEQRYRVNAVYDDSDGLSGLVGYTGPVGDRSQSTAEVGVAYQHYIAGGQVLTQRQNVVVPTADLSLTWPWQEGSQLTVKAISALVPSPTANGALEYGGQAALTHRLPDGLSLLADGDVYHFQDTTTGPSGQRGVITSLYQDAGVGYQFTAGMAGRILASFSRTISNVSGSFDRTAVVADLAFAY